jgi:hypothetical protein
MTEEHIRWETMQPVITLVHVIATHWALSSEENIQRRMAMKLAK